jgi:alkanesulfonate monooxygenase SsuD/methylene tetrahydromethanopterin reductase-like flavin-dependent oxidoreductase (luciferase family)
VPDRLGFTLPVDEVLLSEVPALARFAEDLGYTDAWTYETNGLDVFTPLAAAAIGTRRMRVGTGIAGAFTRPPQILAMHASSLWELAPGRTVLGLGSSTEAIVSDWMGIPFDRPRTRTRQAVEQVRALLQGERVGSFKLSRPPSGPVPVYVGGFGEAMLRMVGDVADGVMFFMAGPRIVPELLAGVGRQMESVARIPVFCGGAAADCEVMARRMVSSYANVPHYGRLLSRQGFGEEVEAIRARWRAGDRAAAAGRVSAAMLGELVSVGGAEVHRERIDAYRRAGLETPVLWFQSPDGSPETLRRTMAEVASAG